MLYSAFTVGVIEANVSLERFSVKFRIMSKYFESAVSKQLVFDIYFRRSVQGTSAVCRFGSPTLDLTIYKKADKIDERAKETG